MPIAGAYPAPAHHCPTSARARTCRHARRTEHPPRGVGSSALPQHAWKVLLPDLIGRDHLAGGLDDQTVRRGAMLGSIPLDGFHTPDPKVLGEAVSVHGV
jgi:hypothetical protein